MGTQSLFANNDMIIQQIKQVFYSSIFLTQPHISHILEGKDFGSFNFADEKQILTMTFYDCPPASKKA